MSLITRDVFNNQFEDKLVLVTGASRGIGKVIAELFAVQGATVIGTATTEAGANEITRYLQQYNNKNRGLQLDIANKQSITDLLDNINAVYDVKGPDILINNAGITEDNLILRMNDEQWDRVINTNLTGVFNLIKPCVKHMVKKRWGRIINISSVVASMGNPGQVNYVAAKAGMIGITKSLAKELASRDITVNAVSPGYIETDMTDKLTDAQKAELAKNIPLARVGSALDVANGVLFLASSMSNYITGQTLHINGGMYMN
jgi:3-oxoacyl-[acyl-carrier protein] reductase